MSSLHERFARWRDPGVRRRRHGKGAIVLRESEKLHVIDVADGSGMRSAQSAAPRVVFTRHLPGDMFVKLRQAIAGAPLR